MIKLKLILTIFTPDCSFDWQREKIVNEEQKKMNQILFDIGCSNRTEDFERNIWNRVENLVLKNEAI